MDERVKLWKRLNSDHYQKFREETEGVWCIHSGQDGPHLWIVGAVHGNEAVGAVVISELLERALTEPLLTRGRITLVIGNPNAFLEDLRYIDQDLNRAFAEDVNEIADQEVQRKWVLTDLLQLDSPDFVLDLHSVSRGDHGIIVYPEESKEWAETLCCLDRALILRLKEWEKNLSVFKHCLVVIELRYECLKSKSGVSAKE